MKLSRIDQIALNGGDGLHYKYESVAEDIAQCLFLEGYAITEYVQQEITKILVENFPDA